MDAVPVGIARSQTFYIPVPDFIGVLGQHEPLDFPRALRVEDAQFDGRGMGGKQGKVDAAPVQIHAARIGTGAAWIWNSFP